MLRHLNDPIRYLIDVGSRQGDVVIRPHSSSIRQERKVVRQCHLEGPQYGIEVPHIRRDAPQHRKEVLRSCQ